MTALAKSLHSRIDGPNGSLEVTCLSGTSAWERIEADWRALYGRCGLHTPFLHYDWMRTWWECRSEPVKLDILRVAENGIVIGIAPMMRRRQKLGFIAHDDLFFLTAYENPFSERAVSGSLDLLWDPAFDNRRVSFARYLLTETRGWRYLRLNPIPEASPTIPAFETVAAELGLAVKTPWVLKNAVLTLEGDWESYFEGRSGKFRKNLRRALRNLSENHAVAFREYRSEADIDRAVEQMLAIEAASWKETRGFAIDDASLNRFYERIVRTFARQGHLRLWVLMVDRRPVAYDLHLDVDGHVKTLKGSYAAESGDYSPGSLLTWKATERFFAEGVREVDLLWGSLHYKEKWTNHLETQHGIYLRRNDLLSRVIARIYRSDRLRRLVGHRKPSRATGTDGAPDRRESQPGASPSRTDAIETGISP